MTTRKAFRYYNRNVLLSLIIGYVIGLLLLIIPYALIGALNDNASGHAFLVSTNWLGSLGGIAVLLFIAEAIFVMAYDKAGALTLRGLARSQIMHQGKLVNTAPSYVLLYLFLPEIMLPIYLIRTVMGLRQDKEQRRFAMKQQIALMEAKLGILPPTSGTCRACNKPLQVGAEFCQYCGVAVIERPKVCPSCATSTFPDANWCPKCGIRLP
jgi:hypothetical protein